ncbi:OmpA family protein [Thioclava sp. FR2]|uniref:OmpA family protein n=1 Tax=Thioclava sp. FR2 TaxID=3445780 RepID=UPI003EB7085A
MIAKLNSGYGRDMTKVILGLGVFVVGAMIAALAAWASAIAIEARTTEAVRSKMVEANYLWVNVSADGLQLHLSGTAPNEAARFRAVNLAGGVIDSSRVRDLLDVAPVKAIEAPKFSVEILRNDDGIQLIGLLPNSSDPKAFVAEAEALDQTTPVANMLETANYPPSEGWEAAFDFGVRAMKLLPRSKISIAAGQVEVKAIADSLDQQRRLESDLARERPEGISTKIEISAPRPVLTPFTLRFVVDADGARFDACSADTERARDKILAAGVAAGVVGKASCTIGLGVPSPSWADAAVMAISSVAKLGAATVTFSDADVSLDASNTVSQADFDRVVGELQSKLPEVFSLTANLERKSDTAAGPVEFTAKLSANGVVELRGRLTDDRLRDAVDSFAQARFGVGKVQTLTRLDEDLPDGWPIRVLAGLEALEQVVEGDLLVRMDLVELKGVTGSQSARDRISQILSDKLGQGETFRISVRYDEDLDPLAALPTPEECAEDVQAVLKKRKITFPPGSAEIDGTAATIMDALAEVLSDCPAIRMEIAGHTDSQGSEGGNQALSQARAEAVLLALQGRGVDVSGLSARGYGEAVPIEDNGTEAGREANRRIDFTLLEQPQPAPTDTQPAGNETSADGNGAGDPNPETTANASDSNATDIPETNAPAGDDNNSGDAVVAGSAAETDNDAAQELSEDDSPSVAPTEKTRRPLARPSRDG